MIRSYKDSFERAEKFIRRDHTRGGPTRISEIIENEWMKSTQLIDLLESTDEVGGLRSSISREVAKCRAALGKRGSVAPV